MSATKRLNAVVDRNEPADGRPSLLHRGRARVACRTDRSSSRSSGEAATAR